MIIVVEKLKRQQEFKFWKKHFAFHFSLMTLGEAFISSFTALSAIN